MGIQNVIDKIKKFRKENEQRQIETSPPLDDFETRDPSLKSMRRLRRRQEDIIEKKKLSRTIDNFERDRTRSEVFGITQHKESKGLMKKMPIKKISMLSSSSPFLKKSKKEKSMFFN